eukprot:gene16728-50073_t
MGGLVDGKDRADWVQMAKSARKLTNEFNETGLEGEGRTPSRNRPEHTYSKV